MMEQSKKGSTNLTCHVCKIDFNSNADHALHEFSKKHCDNLIRIAKQKPIVSKQKPKIKVSQAEKEPPKVNSIAHTGSFAKYGYFIPGEIYANPEKSREYNTDYDPYLQKFAENPFKEKPNLPSATEASTLCSVASFSKKKKMKIKSCQVCNVTFSTVPEYEAHMKSPQHIWKLKVTGMGVSAHFVKASSDLHTTDMNEENKSSYQIIEQTAVESTSAEGTDSGPFPLLYCSDCELLLNSPQQYNAHINGKFHVECAQRKADLKAKKEKLENPSPNQLYCYSCKISLNNLFQYNEHKNGKKHKTKCRNLVRKGITIPPEERVPGIPLPNLSKPVIYPELYEKLVLEKQKQRESENKSGSIPELSKNDGSQNSSIPTTIVSGSFANGPSEGSMNADQSLELCCNSKVNINYSAYAANDAETKTDSSSVSEHNNSESFDAPKIIFHKNCAYLKADPPELILDNSNLEAVSSEADVLSEENHFSAACSSNAPIASTVEGSKKQVAIITDNSPLTCRLCNEGFQWQAQLDGHLSTEDHLKKILEVKQSGRTESDILNALFSDRDVVKPNHSGKFTCSICSVTTNNSVEYHQHLKSIVHKYTHRDYKMKRALEVKHIVGSNEDGLYFCKLCKEGWPSLVEYTQHLHFAKHKSIQRAQRAKAMLAKRRTSCVQKPRLLQSLRKRNVPLRRVKMGKNPGVRTKICGMAVDLNSGTQAPIPNLEPLEPKIDMTKNVSIGACEKESDNEAAINNNNNIDKVKVANIRKRCKLGRSNRKSGPNHQKSGPYRNGPPFLPSGNMIPPLMSSPSFPPRFSRPGYSAPSRTWPPLSCPHPSMLGPFFSRPAISNPYLRPPWYQRLPWLRYR